MMALFYNTGRLKKKRYETYHVSFWRDQRIEHRVWMGEFEPEPSIVKSKKGQVWIDEAPKQKKNNLPKQFLPKPAYRGAK